MTHETSASENETPSAPPDAETLIGRLIDREANDDDRVRFEHLADGATDLWKTLALRQLDNATLSDRICAATEPAERVDVLFSTPRRWRAGLAFSGCAAALLIGLWC